jgi:hypothetical protein
MFGTADDIVVISPGGSLFDDTSFYGAHQRKKFEFRMRLTCSSPVPIGSRFSLKAVVDHGADDYPAIDDEDFDRSDNFRTRVHRIR